MTEKLKQIIKEEVTKLPKEAQDAIGIVDWASIAEEIGKKYLLNESEINDLQVETLLVLVGIETGSLYTSNIENEVGTSKADAEKIAQEANQKIFTPIYNILEENIKKNLPSRRATPEQNLNFILSGGDYVAFLEQREPLARENTPSTPPPKEEALNSSLSFGEGRGGVRTKEANKNTSLPSGPRKMTDIRPVVNPSESSTSGVKSKFTI